MATLKAFEKDCPYSVNAQLHQRESDLTHFDIEILIKGPISELQVMGDFDDGSDFKRGTDLLWKETCFEVFLGWHTEAYFELNVTPDNREYHRFFKSYRELEETTKKRPTLWLQLEERFKSAQEIRYRFNFYSEDLVDLKDFNLSCMLFTLSGRKFHFALQHGEKPDFHKRELWQAL